MSGNFLWGNGVDADWNELYTGWKRAARAGRELHGLEESYTGWKRVTRAET
jgi:hypothetical protein